MHPERVRRQHVERLTDLPNVGPRIAAALRSIGIDRPADLVDRDPLDLYRDLCARTGQREDPCALDVFISITRFMAGDEPRRWWAYSAERKRRFPDL